MTLRLGIGRAHYLSRTPYQIRGIGFSKSLAIRDIPGSPRVSSIEVYPYNCLPAHRGPLLPTMSKTRDHRLKSGKPFTVRTGLL